MTKALVVLFALSLLVGSQAFAQNPLMKAACRTGMGGKKASESPIVQSAIEVANGRAGEIPLDQNAVNATVEVLANLVKGQSDSNVGIISGVIGSALVVRTGEPTILVSATGPQEVTFGALKGQRAGTLDLHVLRMIPVSLVGKEGKTFDGGISARLIDSLPRGATAPKVSETVATIQLDKSVSERKALAIHTIRLTADASPAAIDIAMNAIVSIAANASYR